jgi:shikimate kinase
MKIFLIGMMGSGKSYWAKYLSNEYQIPWIDLDAAIEKANNLTIETIFASKGEVFFREQEQEILRTIEAVENIIVATGGGAPYFHNNMQWMNEQGTTIWIDEPIDVLVSRLIQEKKHRPLIKNLSDIELAGFLIKNLDERKPFYEQAKFHLNSNSMAIFNPSVLSNQKKF